MFKMDKVKQVHESVKIPEELTYVVNRAVAKKRKNNYSIYQKFALSGCVCFVAMIAVINTNPVLAKNISEIPVIGSIAKVFTISEYHKKDETKLIDVKTPAIENTGNTELEQRVNYEILNKINLIIQEAEERAKDYKEAVLSTGGNLKDYIPVNIYVDYEIKYNKNNVISFVISKTETLANAYTEQFYYNMDIESGKNLNLKDLFGSNYKQIIDEEIKKQIATRSRDSNNVYFDEWGKFEGIEDENQGFYINEKGNVVIVFPKYAIAPGYMGMQEFEIESTIKL